MIEVSVPESIMEKWKQFLSILPHALQERLETLGLKPGAIMQDTNYSIDNFILVIPTEDLFCIGVYFDITRSWDTEKVHRRAVTESISMQILETFIPVEDNDEAMVSFVEQEYLKLEEAPFMFVEAADITYALPA